MKETNRCFVTALIGDVRTDFYSCERVRRPVYDAITFDKNGEKAKIRIIFSSLTQIRNASGLKSGDMVSFEGFVSEFPEDSLAFYPTNIDIESADLVGDTPPAREVVLKERCFNSPNMILVEGIVSDSCGCASIIKISKPSFVRGEICPAANIAVKHAKNSMNKGQRVLFEGEIGAKGLVGRIWTNG